MNSDADDRMLVYSFLEFDKLQEVGMGIKWESRGKIAERLFF